MSAKRNWTRSNLDHYFEGNIENRIEMGSKFFKRSVNEGFSGGEKKRNEILQMAVLKTTLAILDDKRFGTRN